MCNDNSKNINIMDVLYSNANTTQKMKQLREKVFKTLTRKEFLESLTFEQQITLVQTMMGSEALSNKFIIDFYRVNSKSEGISKALEAALANAGLLPSAQPGQVLLTDTSTSSETQKLVREAKQKILSAIDKKAYGDTNG